MRCLSRGSNAKVLCGEEILPMDRGRGERISSESQRFIWGGSEVLVVECNEQQERLTPERIREATTGKTHTTIC